MEFVVYRQDVLKRVVIGGVIVFIVAIGFTITRHYVYLNYHFNGRVDSIRYGDKGTAVVIIRGKEFALEEDWSKGMNVPINKVDSMLKLEDSTWVKLIRVNGVTIVK